MKETANKPKILFVDFRNEFVDIVKRERGWQAEFSNESVGGLRGEGCDNYDIAAIDESGCIIYEDGLRATYVLCPHSSPCRGEILCRNVISCGMGLDSTFGISSLREDKGMFSVSRTIRMESGELVPFETPFKPDNRLTPYENIILHGIEEMLKCM